MSHDLTYCGYWIVCEVGEVPGKQTWMAKAAIVQPADENGLERVYPILAARSFLSEKSASHYFIAEAKKWIDTQIRNQLGNEIIHLPEPTSQQTSEFFCRMSLA